MYRSPCLTLVVCCLVGALGLPALRAQAPAAGEVRIISPTADSVVRGDVELKAEQPNMDSGSFTWRLSRLSPDQRDYPSRQIYAAAKHVLATRERDDTGKRTYPDGRYRLTVDAISDGNTVGTATCEFAIQNGVPDGEHPEEVTLVYGGAKGDVYTYIFKARSVAWLDEEEPDQKTQDALSDALDQIYIAKWYLNVLEGRPGQGGMALAQVTDGVRGPANDPEALEWIEERGREFRMRIAPDGVISDPGKAETRFYPAEPYLAYSPRPQKPGGPGWASDLTYLGDVSYMDYLLTKAQHQLLGFEYWGDHKCAYLVSTHEDKPPVVHLRPGGNEAIVKPTVEVKRETFYDYEQQMVVHVEDTLTLTFDLDAGQLQTKQQGGAGGGMMGGGMMGGGMMGGPGMGGAEGGAGTGGMGTPGMGGGQKALKVKMIVKFWTEVQKGQIE